MIVVNFLFHCYVGNDILTLFVLKHNPLISRKVKLWIVAIQDFLWKFSHCNGYSYLNSIAATDVVKIHKWPKLCTHHVVSLFF